MKNVLLLMFDNVEELEAIAPIDILRRAGANVVVASVAEKLFVKGRSNIEIKCDVLFNDVKEKSFDAVVVSGGAGVNDIVKNADLLKFINRHNQQNAIIGAICAAPVVLKQAGVLQGKQCTAHTSRVSELENCDISKPVVCDGNIITSRGAGTAIEFALTLAEKIFSAEITKEVANSICFMR